MRNFRRTQRNAAYEPDALPCMVLKGPPLIYMWPKVTLDVNGEHVTVDALVRIGKKDPQWLFMEIDEDGVITPASARREEILDMPCVRVDTETILREDFVPEMIRRFTAAVPRRVA